MEKTIEVGGQTVKLATITVGVLEQCDLAGKSGRKFNIAVVVSSLLAAGDPHATEQWVRSLPAFAPADEDSPFQKMVNAANLVNYFETEEQQEQAQKEKAAKLAAARAGLKVSGESEPAAPAGA